MLSGRQCAKHDTALSSQTCCSQVMRGDLAHELYHSIHTVVSMQMSSIESSLVLPSSPLSKGSTWQHEALPCRRDRSTGVHTRVHTTEARECIRGCAYVHAVMHPSRQTCRQTDRYGDMETETWRQGMEAVRRHGDRHGDPDLETDMERRYGGGDAAPGASTHTHSHPRAPPPPP